MSAPGDLTFYKTLGSGGPVAAGGFSAPPGSSSAAGPPGAQAATAATGATPGGAPAHNNDRGGVSMGPGPVGSASYIVQVLATRDARVARRMRERLAARGFPAIVREDRSGGQVVYRVRAGRYFTRAEADAAARVLHRSHLSPWVLQEGL